MRAQQMPGTSGHGSAGGAGGSGGGGGAPGAPPIPIGMPHPIAPGGALSAAQLSGLTGAPPTGGPGGQHPLSIINKQDLHRPEESKSSGGMSGVPDDRHRQSISPLEREKYRPRSPSDQHEMSKKIKKEEKDMGHVSYKIYILTIFHF